MIKSIIQDVLNEKIIVIVRGIEKDKLIPLAEAMYKGGIRFLEVTYDQSGKMSDSETAENIKMLKKYFGSKMQIGAGTVITEKQVELTSKAGGEFIISPDTNPDVIRKTKELGLVSMPGAITPTEILSAHRSGADFVKIFPVVSLGADYVKAIKAPISNVRLLAVGGINCENISEYLKAGIDGFGIGSNIIDKKLIEAEDYDGITKLASLYVKAVKGE